jgi:hypothetical protein
METTRNKLQTFFADFWLYRMVVGVLGLAVLICAVGAIALALNNMATPEFLVMLGSAAVGALAGLLTPGLNAKS